MENKEKNQQKEAQPVENSSFLKSSINNNKQATPNVFIKQIRIAKGLTQSDLSRLCGFTSEYINMIERGKVFPILETRIKIAQALGCDTSSLWDLENKGK